MFSNLSKNVSTFVNAVKNMVGHLLKEDGFHLLLETGDRIILEPETEGFTNLTKHT